MWQPLRWLDALDQFVGSVERSRSRPLLFGALTLVLVGLLFPFDWHPNEEGYLQLAYRKVAPQRFSPLHAVFDASFARYAPEVVLGWVLRLFGTTAGQPVLRVGMAIAYAAGLTYLFAALRLSAWDAVLVIVLFVMAGQDLLGGEWLFAGVEPKTLAYALLFFSLGAALRRRWLAAILLSAAATYMHFLVGGFWTLVILGLAWRDTRQLGSVARSVATYAVLTLPLAVAIAAEQSTGSTLTADGLSATRIYAERVAHHASPFADPFAHLKWLPGIATMFALMLALGVVRRRGHVSDSVRLSVLEIAYFTLLYLHLAVVLAFFDRHTLVLTKFYLFRPSSLALLLAIVGLVAVLSSELTPRGTAIKGLITAVLGISLAANLVSNGVRTWRRGADLPERPALVAAIQTHTQPTDVVLIEPYRELEGEYVSLHRHIPRPTLVSWKFVPTTPEEILRWHALQQMRVAIFAHGCQARVTEPVRWLVTLRRETLARVAACGPTVWRRGNVALIRVDRR
ncbi:MAG TPA: hypothetical protein VFM14_05660 [Gemmatimonadales bacterium]|nr:hypothetical protein [Gemmatimonadales bacterium]